MPSDPTGSCPIDIHETAEAYAMKRLSPTDALAFAAHCTTCGRCAAAVASTRQFLQALKVAARWLKGKSGNRTAASNHASFTSITPMPKGSFRVRMRFDVTLRDPPRSRQ